MPRRQAVLDEALRIRLEDYVEGELPGLVDYRTGEILQERAYASLPYRPQSCPVLPDFKDIRSVQQLERFMGQVDQRTLVTINHTRRIYDMDKGHHHLYNRSASFTNLQYHRMNWLVSRLDYGNSIVTTPASLAGFLKIRRDKVYRYLSSLYPLVRFRGNKEGMVKGSMRIDLSPAYGYRCPKGLLQTSQQAAITYWYRALLQ